MVGSKQLGVYGPTASEASVGMPSSTLLQEASTGALQGELTEDDCAVKLSALLKKAHIARTAALFNGDTISEHITREAERLGLDRNMVLGAYMGFIAHILNPCA